MACNDYSNGSAPQVVFSMSTLPGGFCPDGYQALFDAIATYLQGTLPGNYSTFLIRDTTPAVTDRDKLWLSVDPSNCRPLGFYLYSTAHATWVPVGNQVWNGDGSWSGTVIQSTVSPTLKYLTDGHLFIIKAPTSANAGAADLNVSSLGDKDITKFGGQPLEGGEILPNALLLLTWRTAANAFELLNPAPASANLTPVNRLINGSFEVDSDADGIPDGWDFDVNGGTPGGATGTISTSTVGHGANSFSINGAANTSGALVMQEMQPCKGNDTYADGELMLLSFWQQTSNVLNDDVIEVEWFDKDGASLGASTIWSWNTAAAANTWKQFYAPMVPLTGARFFQLSIIGNSTGGGTGISYYDGLAVETITFKRQSSCSTAGTYTWNCPTGIYSARVTCIGGGGGGGAGAGGNAGAGGGAGGRATSIISVTPLTAYTVIVGAGGAAGAAGGDGGAGTNSDFGGGTVIGNGAAGGQGAGTGINGGAGGGGTGQFVVTGGNGANSASPVGGDGGSGCSFGGNNGAPGGAGGSPGGGGGGGDAAQAGGAGASGQVLIEY